MQKYKQNIIIKKRVGVRDPESQAMTWKTESYEALVFLEIDVASIAEKLGQRASESKRKTSAFMDGRIKAEVQVGKMAE